jgi:hypothetical protein
MSKKSGGNATGKTSGSGANRPPTFMTGTVQKDAGGGNRPKPYGTGKVQEGETRS